MKVVYAAYRHDPHNPDLASGADHSFYTTYIRQGFDVKVVGPFSQQAFILERLIRRCYTRLSKRRYAKFPISLAWYVSQRLNAVERAWQPDVIFTMFPPSLVFYKGVAPCVYRLDTCFIGWQQQYPEFGAWALQLLTWQERRAFTVSTRIVTHSEWTRRVLIDEYHVAAQKIAVFPNPSALPRHVVPSNIKIELVKRLQTPLRLLLVGRDYHRKGVDIAIHIVKLINSYGVPAELTICGLKGDGKPNIQFVGLFRKSKPEELQQYAALYRQAHLLLHPARWDPSPIAVAEAAAFGVPTITNNVGGLATSVKHGESGIVLPQESPPEAYAQAILELIEDPERYYALCHSTRRRYEQELNWDAAGQRVAAILEQVVRDNPRRKL